MSKPKRFHVSPEMRSRLRLNRDGRMTSDQWKDMVTQPLVVLLLLLVPIILFAGPRIIALSWRGMLFVVVVLLLIVGVPMIFRAFRYARLPVNYDRLYTGVFVPSRLFFWRPTTLYTSGGEPVRFTRRLAPFMRLEPESAYLVYYLQEPHENILLSMAPAEHPQAGEWEPSEFFHTRRAQRR